MKVQSRGTVEPRMKGDKQYKDKFGRRVWRLRLYLMVPVLDDKGKPVINENTGEIATEEQRPTRPFHGTKTEAWQALDEWRNGIERGLKVDADKTTVSAYCDVFHTQRVELGRLAPNSLKREAEEIAKIKTYFGNILLCDLDVATIEATYATMRSNGAVTEGGLHRLHKTFKQILRKAVNSDVLLRNPCDKVTDVKPARPAERHSLSEFEAMRLLRIVTTGDMTAEHLAIVLALNTGMRKGEVFGLIWANVDIDNGMIYVRQQYNGSEIRPPKSDAGRRSIAIDADAVTILKEWHERQRVMLSDLCIITDEMTEDEIAERIEQTPVCCNAVGGFYNAGHYTRWFHNFCALHGFGEFTDDEGNKAEPTRWGADGHRIDGNGRDAQGRPYSRVNPKCKGTRHYSGLKFHELRHTQATLLIANGEDIKTVQNRLGHSKVSLTLDLYAHATPENDRKAANLIGSILTDKAGKYKNVENL